MQVDPENINLLQLALFELHKTSSGTIELFPKVWAASEALADVNVENRREGLDCLEELKAARFSPLVSYLLFTKLADPDLGLRGRVIKILADALSPDEEGQFAPEVVRQTLLSHLSQMQSFQIHALLESVVYDSTLEAPVGMLLKADCMAGSDLTDILADRKQALAIRIQAVNFIARVGFVDATPCLERLLGRIESRVNGQQAFSFNQMDAMDEAQLLPPLKTALTVLQAP
jgi:hypothetical protein